MPHLDDEEDDLEWLDDEGDEEEIDEDEETDLDLMIEETTELVETGEAKKAVRIWKRALDRFADEPDAYLHLGHACAKYLEEELGGRKITAADTDLTPYYDEGVSAFEETISMEPESIEALNALGYLHQMRGRPKAAREVWEKSLQIDPDQTDITSELEDL